MEIQSNDALLAVMLHTYARDIMREAIVFRDAAARCNRDNRSSRKTLQKAGFVPYAHILNGTIDGLT